MDFTIFFKNIRTGITSDEINIFFEIAEIIYTKFDN